MRIQEVLKYLEKLLRKWGITPDDWIFTAQYAVKLLGYDVEVRKGHLNILIRKSKIPWEIGEELEAHPPVKSKYTSDYRKFISKTGFEFDIVPLTYKKFKRRMSNTVPFHTPKNLRINILTGWGGLEELDEILSKCTDLGWGVEKGYRVYPYLEMFRKAALKKGETELADAYAKLHRKHKHFQKVREQKIPRETETVTGVVASKGKAKGVVNVVLNPEITKKFAKREILVTTMTSPKFTIFLRKCGAVVTDEGGMLSHAAIIARELKIPCIVGTKIATKVLKDGDLVEVDANKGIVRKLKSEGKSRSTG